jgi:diguanylate cyclase (GGDEF)-like protein
VGKPPVAEELYARLRVAERFGIMQRELIRLATTDSLTGMYNRRAFFEKAKALGEGANAGALLCAAMVDIDHFKRINDAHGHEAGDNAICAVANELMRECELVGRLGGEEFAVMLEGHCQADAVAIGERLRVKLAELPIKAGAETVTLTCSFGISEWRHGDTIDSLLKRADMALYEAKMSGRNRVIAADDSMPMPTYSDAASRVRAARKSA